MVDGLSLRGRRLLQLLSVLELPHVSAPVAAAVLECDLRAGAALLDDLADAGLLDVTRSPIHPPHYRFPELVLSFARRQVGDLGEEHRRRDIVERALSAVLGTAEAARRRVEAGGEIVLRGHSRWWNGGGDADLLPADPQAWLQAGRGCLSAGVTQAAELGLHELCRELATVAVALHEAQGRSSDWRNTHLTALDAVGQAGNHRGQAAVLTSLGGPGLCRHRADDETVLLEALDCFVDVGDRAGRTLALRTLAHLDRLQGRPERAIERYREALALCDAEENTQARAEVLIGLAGALLDLEILDEAEVLTKESLLLNQNLKAPGGRRRPCTGSGRCTATPRTCWWPGRCSRSA